MPKIPGRDFSWGTSTRHLSVSNAVRTGYGIFYDSGYYPGWWGGVAQDGFNSSPTFGSSMGGLSPAFLLQEGFPQGFQNPPYLDPGFLNGQAGPNYRPKDGNRLPYTQQWNFTIERQVGKDLTVSGAYVGNKGTRLLSRDAPLNALNPSLLSTYGSQLHDEFQAGQTSLDGHSPSECAKAVTGEGADAVGANCEQEPERMLTILRNMRAAVSAPIAAQPAAFRTTDEVQCFTRLPEFPDGLETIQISRIAFEDFGKVAAAEGVQFVGGCCGCNAAYIRAAARGLSRVKEADV